METFHYFLSTMLYFSITKIDHFSSLRMFSGFKQFLYILHSKLWAHFHFGTFDQ